MNHQPCGAYLKNSTRLSRQVSMTTVDLESANVHLENVILGELDGIYAPLDPIIDSLQSAERNLQVALDVCDDLRRQMEENEYHDLPTLKTVNLDSLGQVLSKGRIVESQAWVTMVRMIKNGTFYSNIGHFENGFRLAMDNIGTLREKFELLSQEAQSMVQVAERNLKGNFKVAFAKAFTQWLRFHQEFLASSLVSTELYYASFGAPSLAEEDAPSDEDLLSVA